MKFNEHDLSVIKATYEKLTDDESKRIYDYRLLYSLTGDTRYIYDMISSMVKEHRDEINIKTKEAGINYNLYEKSDLYRFLQQNSKKANNRIVLFGAGAFGRDYKYWLDSVGFPASAFCDNDISKIGTIVEGLQVVSPTYFENEKDCLIVISSLLYHNEIMDQLKHMGIDDSRIYKYEHNALLSYFGIPYFDSMVVKPKPGEVFVDGGAYCGETAMEFASWCPSYSAIYSFEPDRKNFIKFQKNINAGSLKNTKIFNFGLWDSKEELKFARGGDEGTGSAINENGADSICTVSLDEILGDEKVDYIKLDIEGAELRALKGAKKIIMNQKPDIAVCIYHRPEDVVAIPEYLMKIVPEYSFTIRHYTTFIYDTVLYAQVEK